MALPPRHRRAKPAATNAAHRVVERVERPVTPTACRFDGPASPRPITVQCRRASRQQGRPSCCRRRRCRCTRSSATRRRWRRGASAVERSPTRPPTRQQTLTRLVGFDIGQCATRRSSTRRRSGRAMSRPRPGRGRSIVRTMRLVRSLACRWWPARSTIRLPNVLPSRTIAPVVSMFKHEFRRGAGLEPRRTAQHLRADHGSSMANRLAAPSSDRLLHARPIVNAPTDVPRMRPPRAHTASARSSRCRRPRRSA